MESINKELNKLLKDVDIIEKAGNSKSSYKQMIDELKNYSNIVSGFRKKSLVGKETLRLKIT